MYICIYVCRHCMYIGNNLKLEMQESKHDFRKNS